MTEIPNPSAWFFAYSEDAKWWTHGGATYEEALARPSGGIGMTREERAREAYAQAVERLGGPARMSIAADIRADTSSDYYHVTMAAMLAFADAEAAAMREIVKEVAEADSEDTIGSIGVDIPYGGYPRQWIRDAARRVLGLDDVRSLPATGEVERG